MDETWKERKLEIDQKLVRSRDELGAFHSPIGRKLPLPFMPRPGSPLARLKLGFKVQGKRLALVCAFPSHLREILPKLLEGHNLFACIITSSHRPSKPTLYPSKSKKVIR
jgi:hypothetical protein